MAAEHVHLDKIMDVETPSVAAEPVDFDKIMEVPSVAAETAILRN